MEFVIAYDCPIGRQSVLTTEPIDAYRILKLCVNRGYSNITVNGEALPDTP